MDMCIYCKTPLSEAACCTTRIVELRLNTKYDEAMQTVYEMADVLEWLEKHEPDILYKEPCQFQYDSRCRGYTESDTGAWICGNDDECPLHLGRHGNIQASLYTAKRLLEEWRKSR